MPFLVYHLPLADRILACTIKSNCLSKNIRILVYADGRVLVTKPIKTSNKTAISFLQDKSAWIAACLKKFQERSRPNTLLGSRSHFLTHRQQAAIFIRERLDFFSRFYGLAPGRISIRNQNTRWGSCSRAGNLNFNYRLIFLEPAAADYVIVHELCHLKEFNHSPAFWRLVAGTVPNYRYWRRRLKKMDL